LFIQTMLFIFYFWLLGENQFCSSLFVTNGIWLFFFNMKWLVLKFEFFLVIQSELTNQLIEMAGFSFFFSQPDKRWAGISLLGVTCEECSSDRFEESYTVWFQKLLTCLQVISCSFPWLHIILLLAFLYSSFWEYIIYCLVPVYNILCVMSQYGLVELS